MESRLQAVRGRGRSPAGSPVASRYLKEIYAPNPKAERDERIAGRFAAKSIRRAAKKHSGIDD